MSLVIPKRTTGHGSNGSFEAATQSNSQQASNVNDMNNLISTQATASPFDGSSVLNTQERADRELIREMVTHSQFVFMRTLANGIAGPYETGNRRHTASSGYPVPKNCCGEIISTCTATWACPKKYLATRGKKILFRS